MRLDDDPVGCGVTGYYGLRRLAEPSGEARLVDKSPDIAGTVCAPAHGFDHALGDLGLAVPFDKAHELLDLVFEIDVSPGYLL